MQTSDESKSPNQVTEYFHRLRSDLAVAAHSISRAPTFAIATIAILGLSIGVSTAMFTIYKTVLVDRLPVIAQEQLVVMHPLRPVTVIKSPLQPTLPWRTLIV